MSNSVTRLLEYIRNQGDTKYKFYKKTGLSNGFLDKNRNIGSDKCEIISTQYPNLNLEWLITGKGEMEKTDVQNLKHNENITFSEETKKEKNITLLKGDTGIPLIPIDAMAGFGNGNIQVMDYDTKNYVVPEFTELNVDFMIKVKGDSMYPKYNSGDLVACKKLHLHDTFFQWNKVYVLDTEQGALIKHIKKGKDGEHLLLVSDNSDYDPFELHLDNINALALVVGVIRLE